MDENTFEENLKELAKNFFNNHPPLKSREELDEFLDSLNLLEFWSDDVEKDMFWATLIKYQVNNEINYESSIKGLHDFLTQDEEENDMENNEPNLGASTLRMSRFSRMSYALNNQNKKPHHKREITKFFTKIETKKLIQIQKVYSLLNLDNGVREVSIEEVENLINNRLTTLTKGEIVNYLIEICDISIEEKSDINAITDFIINENFYVRANNAIEKQIENANNKNSFGEIEENSSDNEEDNQENFNNYDIESNPIDYVDVLIKTQESNNEKISMMVNLKNSIRSTNENLSITLYKIKGDINITPVFKVQNLLVEQPKEFEQVLKELKKNERDKTENLGYLKNGIKKLNSDNIRLEEENKILDEEVTNQRLNVEEEMEKLINDNIILQRDREELQNNLSEIRKINYENESNFEMEKMKNNQFQIQISEMTSTINRLKFEKEDEKRKYNDYVKMLNEIMTSTQERRRNEKEIEQTEKEKEAKEKEEEIVVDIEEVKVKEKKVIEDNLKKLSQMSYDKLLNYSVQVDIANQTLQDEIENLRIEKKRLEMIEEKYNKMKMDNDSLKVNNEMLSKEITKLETDLKESQVTRYKKCQKHIEEGRMSVFNMKDQKKDKSKKYKNMSSKDVMKKKNTNIDFNTLTGQKKTIKLNNVKEEDEFNDSEKIKKYKNELTNIKTNILINEKNNNDINEITIDSNNKDINPNKGGIFEDSYKEKKIQNNEELNKREQTNNITNENTINQNNLEIKNSKTEENKNISENIFKEQNNNNIQINSQNKQFNNEIQNNNNLEIKSENKQFNNEIQNNSNIQIN